MAGPIFSDIESLAQMIQGSVVKTIDGKDPKIGAKLVRFVKGHTPGTNLWYAKEALNHMTFHEIQEYFSPRYLHRMKQRAEREFGQSYWWDPGAGTPERGPNLGAVFGE